MLDKSGSLVVAESTVAVLHTLYEMPFAVSHTVPPDPLNVDATTLIVMIATPPTLSDGIVHPTAPPLCVQLPCVANTFVNVTCAGSVSATEMFCATAGPLFVTCSVYVRFAP